MLTETELASRRGGRKNKERRVSGRTSAKLWVFRWGWQG